MFNVKVGEFNIQFTFQHMRNIGELAGVQAVSVCTLKVNGKAFTGVAACSRKDQFQYDAGRKRALVRALQEARKAVELPHEVRKCVWLRYFNRSLLNKDIDLFAGLGFTGTLDPQYDVKPRVGSDDLVNMA